MTPDAFGYAGLAHRLKILRGFWLSSAVLVLFG